MRALLTLLLVIGAFMIVTGMYEQKVLDALDKNTAIEYRFIPRSTYEEQMDATAVSTNTQRMFRDAPLATSGRSQTL
jgi:hypothetical protein